MHFPEESQSISQQIEQATSILAVSHANPDADAVASLLAFARVFGVSETRVDLAIGRGTIPETLAFLRGASDIERVEAVKLEQYDLLVYLDCADEMRVGDVGDELLAEAKSQMPVINIDHHVSNTRFASTNLIDPESAATCEILVLLFNDLGAEIDPETATILMTGIQGDTLGLRTPSTTGQTMEVSAQLLRAGANLDTIVDFLFRMRPYSTLKLWAHALSAVTFTGKLIWTEITPEMLDDSGADESEAEGIVNFLAGTIGARAAAIMYRKADGWRVSMRSLSDDVDVSFLASLFGGGGHSRAAGCTLTGDEQVRDAFLQAISKRIEQQPVIAVPRQ